MVMTFADTVLNDFFGSGAQKDRLGLLVLNKEGEANAGRRKLARPNIHSRLFSLNVVVVVVRS